MPARALQPPQHRPLRHHPSRGLQGPAARDDGAHGAGLARHHGRGGRRSRQALGGDPHLRRHALGDPPGEAMRRFDMMRTAIALLLALPVAVSTPPLGAESTSPAPTRATAPPAAITPESEFNRGLRAQAAKDWPAAVTAYAKATELRPSYAEAWNGLGFALRQHGPVPGGARGLRPRASPPSELPRSARVSRRGVREAGPPRRRPSPGRPPPPHRCATRQRARRRNRKGPLRTPAAALPTESPRRG